MTNRAAGCLSVSWEGKQNRDARCQFFIGGTGSGTHVMVQKIFIAWVWLEESITLLKKKKEEESNILWHLEHSSRTSTLWHLWRITNLYKKLKIKKMPYDHYEMTLLILEVN